MKQCTAMCCRWDKEEGSCAISLVFSTTDTRSPTPQITNWCSDTYLVHKINSRLLVQVKQHLVKLKGAEILMYLSKLMTPIGR